MHKLTLLLAAFLYSQTLSAQVFAGVSDQMIKGEEFVNLTAFAFSFGNFQQLQDSLDLDMDGRYDLDFWVEAAKVPDYFGGNIYLYGKHADVSVMLDSANEIRALQAGHPILPVDHWSKPSLEDNYYQGVFLAKYFGISGDLQQYGNWLTTATQYAAFRIKNTAGDTLLGWLKVNASVAPNGASAALKVQEWAIQSAPVVSVSAPELLWKPVLFPNPAKDQVWLSGPENQLATLRLWDARGNLCLSTSVPGSASISLTNLPNGIYFWQWQGASGVLQKGRGF
ncbi:MAG: T9SS type A sorting domain-containing protein [Chitinophagales bacterium]|nr:T9SS type A sorting domain-containing protein [Chitinophagales bacterium]